ncbi:MAG: hypothetical protein [Bacteriophage sp.]|nr:MAG: hypothetical protein [Bacteriophage sp.]
MKISKAFHTVARTTAKHSPIIFTVGGVLGLGATAWLSFKAAKKVETIMDRVEESQEATEVLKQVEIGLRTVTTDEARKDLLATQQRFIVVPEMTRMDIVKEVGAAISLPVVTGIASIACISLSYYIQNNRIVSLASALAVSTAEQTFYRAKYKKEHGEEAAREFYTPTVEEERTVVNAKGKEEKVVDTNKHAMDSMHGLWFDQSSEYASDDHAYNLAFIREQKDRLDLTLFRKGVIKLNDVLDALRMPRVRMGGVVGWSTSQNFDLFPQTTYVRDPQTGEDIPQIYIQWSEAPKDIYNLVED